MCSRLIPLECELLQGYPPGWTGLVGASDTSRYKALENSIAVPCAEFILGGIGSWTASNRDEEEYDRERMIE